MSLKKKKISDLIEIEPLTVLDGDIIDQEISIEFEEKNIQKKFTKTDNTHSFDTWFDFLGDTKEKNSETNTLELNNMPESIEDDSINTIEFEFDATEEDENIEKELKSISIAADDELNKLLDTYIKEQQELKHSQSARRTPVESTSKETLNTSLRPPEIITESMAILYTHQGNFAKAIQMYEKLIVKFPEKCVFFASQIEKIKKN